MTERVLTDKEIDSITGNNCPLKKWSDAVAFARAVEAAVLAKTSALTEMGRATWNQLGLSTPSELAEWMDNLRRVFREGGEVTLGYETRYVPASGERGVPEREARRREVLAKREGWDACIRELNARCTSGPDQTWWWNRADFQRGRDERYPLPTCDKCGQELP